MSGPLLVWSDPPPVQRELKPSVDDPVINALKARPDTWACLGRNPDRKPLQLWQSRLTRAAKSRAAPGRIQSTVRRTRDGEDYGLWARYVPPEAP